MRKSIVVALGSAAAVVLAVSGFAAALASSGVAAAIDDGASPSVSVSASGSPSPDGGNVVVTADQARSIATSVVPGGVVTEIDLRDANTWKVHLNAPDGRYEVLIDATTGAVVKLERSGGATGTATPSPSRSHDDDDDRGRNRGRGGDDDDHDDDRSGRRGGDDDDHDGDDDHGGTSGRG